MASGFGLSGGRPRCFAYWQDFQKCYAGTDDPKFCQAQLGDYFECLHHMKERARAETIKQELIRKAEHNTKEGRKAANVLADGAIVGLGIIPQSQEGQDKKS